MENKKDKSNEEQPGQLRQADVSRSFSSVLMIVYSLLPAALIFLGLKFFKPKKKDNCNKDCNCG